MSKSEQELNRRQFITAGAAAGVATIAGTQAHGAPLEWWPSASKAAVVLHDPRIPMPAEMRRQFESRGTRTIELEGDPVWFWRSTAGAPLRDPATTLMGVTGWPELLVFRGLAAESRRHLRYEKLAASGTFIWMVA